MKSQKLTLDQCFLLGQTELHGSIGILQHDLQHAVFAINLCNFLVKKRQVEILYTSDMDFSLSHNSPSCRHMGKVTIALPMYTVYYQPL